VVLREEEQVLGQAKLSTPYRNCLLILVLKKSLNARESVIQQSPFLLAAL